MQLIEQMDRMLRRENLDLRLTPYRVLATSTSDGLVDFVAAQALSRVLSDYRSINRYLAQRYPDSRGYDGVRPDGEHRKACHVARRQQHTPVPPRSHPVHDNFVRSCAGYSVITYILGVGDRHLDNILLTPEGRLFHIDFGFMMGRDPKPYAALPVRLSPEMIEAMGGPQHTLYRSFRQHCCEAYNILRRKSRLVYSMLHLMCGASLPDIGPDPAQLAIKLQVCVGGGAACFALALD